MFFFIAYFLFQVIEKFMENFGNIDWFTERDNEAITVRYHNSYIFCNVL